MRDVLPFNLKSKMFDASADALVATGVTQPATFCLEYSLAQSWLASGARPTALIGHSVGEFVAAVLAGVMSLPDAARLVAQRGKRMQEMPSGSMLSVRLPLEKLLSLLPPELSLAAENGPNACVAAGPTMAVEAWRTRLEADGVVARMLQTSHAFHSSMMDPVVAPFESEVSAVKLSAPRLPIVSTLTGTWMSAEEATDPHYWARHLREPVRFSLAVKTVLARQDCAFLEVGPRGTLATLARQHNASGPKAAVGPNLSDRRL
jgi:acyl transferase domain-containing protein